jgi:hypothetical protein
MRLESFRRARYARLHDDNQDQELAGRYFRAAGGRGVRPYTSWGGYRCLVLGASDENLHFWQNRPEVIDDPHSAARDLLGV